MTLPLHLGPLHPIEQGLVFVLAFGPFVVLAIVIAVQRRRDRGGSDPPRDEESEG